MSPLLAHGCPMSAQGDLTDPLYFDFISFAQYSTVGTIIPKGLQVFKVRLALPYLCLPFKRYTCPALPCGMAFSDMSL